MASQSVTSLRPLNRQIAKSHLFSPSKTTLSLVASQSVRSLRPLNRQIAKSHFSVQNGLFSQMAVIQLGSDNSEYKTNWKYDKGSQNKITFIDSEKKEYMKAHILQAMRVLHKI